MIDKSALTADFIEETKEHSAVIHEDIIKFHEEPENEDLLNDLLRELHTIKGTSRMLGFSTMEKVSHGLEDVLKAVAEKRIEISGKVVGLTLLTLDMLDSCLIRIKDKQNDEMPVDNFMKAFSSVINGETYERKKLQSEIDGTSGEKDETAANDISLDDVQTIRVKLEKINSIIKNGKITIFM